MSAQPTPSLLPPTPPPPPIPQATAATETFVSPFEERQLDKRQIVDEILSYANQELESINAKYGQNYSGIMVLISSVVQPILQHGPVCGLAALGMACQSIILESKNEVHSSLKLNSLMEEARARGFTKNGEMFSAFNMLDLAVSVTKRKAQILATPSSADIEFRNTCYYECLNGNFFLFPYDADRNHRPALCMGHSAHWALIFGLGFLLNEEQLEIIQSIATDGNLNENNMPKAILFNSRDLTPPQKATMEQVTNKIKAHDSYVIARQGKSLHIGLWPFPDLIASNNNLFEVSPSILKKINDYVISDMEANLKSKLIVINSI